MLTTCCARPGRPGNCEATAAARQTRLSLVGQIVTGKIFVGRWVAHNGHLAELGIAAVQRRPAQTQSFQRRGSGGGNQQIALPQMAMQLFAAFVLLEVEGVDYLLLVEQLIPLGLDSGERVSGRWLDFDHGMPRRCQVGGRQRPGQVTGEREELNSFQGPHGNQPRGLMEPRGPMVILP